MGIALSQKPELKLDWCSYQAAKYAVEHWHYSRSMPAGKAVRMGVWEEDEYIFFLEDRLSWEDENGTNYASIDNDDYLPLTPEPSEDSAWIKAIASEDLVKYLLKKNEQLEKENRLLREQREILMTENGEVTKLKKKQRGLGFALVEALFLHMEICNIDYFTHEDKLEVQRKKDKADL